MRLRTPLAVIFSFILSACSTSNSTITILGSSTEQGSLDTNDQTLDSGEYRDLYSLASNLGLSAIIDLRSFDFDTYLSVISPSGEVFNNDDFEGSRERSLLEISLEESGDYTVVVTSYYTGETGTYFMDIIPFQSASIGPAIANTFAIKQGSRTEQGSLSAGDIILNDGEYADSYAFRGKIGESIQIDLLSETFDTVLVIVSPNGERFSNDDYQGSENRSQVLLELRENGIYQAIVSSYAKDEVGDYSLDISISGSN